MRSKDKEKKSNRRLLIKRIALAVISRILFWPFFLINRSYHVILFGISSRRTCNGFTLYSIENNQIFFANAIAALNKLKEIDLRKYERARYLVPIIAHVRQGGNFYKQSAKAFYVDEVPDDILYFASEIVHEATHAYLLRKGFRYYKEVRERHERICVKEQLSFIIKSIKAQSNVTELQKQIYMQQWKEWFQEHLTSEWWHNKNIRRSRFLAIKKLLKELFS